jgi:hypothetical protein
VGEQTPLIQTSIIDHSGFSRKLKLRTVEIPPDKMASKEKNMALIEEARNFKNVPWCEDYEKMISGMLFVSNLKLKDLRLT